MQPRLFTLISSSRLPAGTGQLRAIDHTESAGFHNTKLSRRRIRYLMTSERWEVRSPMIQLWQFSSLNDDWFPCLFSWRAIAVIANHDAPSSLRINQKLIDLDQTSSTETTVSSINQPFDKSFILERARFSDLYGNYKIKQHNWEFLLR